MTDEHSPWARPETEVVAGATPAYPGPVGGAPATAPALTPMPTSAPAPRRAADPTRPGSADRPAGPGAARSGTVTRLGLPGADVIAGGPPEPADDPAARNRRMMRWFVGIAAGVVAIGLVVVAGLVMTGRTGRDGLLGRPLAGPADTRPDLAKQCPPPSEAADRNRADAPPAPPGPRTVDPDAGISYAAYGEPWQPWDQVWSGGTLRVTYRVGQHFVTEPGPSGDGYHASVLSGSVPATVNDSMVLDLECTGRLVAADVRTEYYYQPNTVEMLRDEQTVVGGLPAWVTKFRLHFNRAGLRAKDELVAVVLVDVGRPEAAILYVSIPGTHREWDRIVDEVIDSVRPA